MPIILKRSISIDNHENLTDAQKEVVYGLLIRFMSRMKELDSKNNIWGTDHFFSDQEVYNHYIDAVKDINTGNPRTSFSLYELKNEDEGLLIDGAIIMALMAEGLLQLRNQVSYSDSGLSINMFDKTQLYQSWLGFLINMYMAKKAEFKAYAGTLQPNGGFVGISSEFGYMGNFDY